MIQLGEYTKEQMAAELGIKGDKASHLTDKLKKLGYTFETSGKARNYRIYITRLPQMGVKDFAQKYLGISARFEDRLTHFLYLLFATGKENQYANMSASSLEWHTYSNNDTIQNWLDSLIDCGLLQEESLIEVYYATKKERLTEPDQNGDYKYTQLWKEIEWSDYERAINAYNETYKSYGDISKNPDVAADEAVFNANMARKDALEGWWAMRKHINYKIVVNKRWPQLNQLLSLLDQYEYVEYQKERTGNQIKEDEAFLDRWIKWEEEKYEKKIRLLEEARQAEEQKKAYEERERQKRVATAMEEAKTLDYFEVITSEPSAFGEDVPVSGSVKQDDFIKQFNNECNEVFSDPRDFLQFINDNYYKTGRWIYYDKR